MHPILRPALVSTLIACLALSSCNKEEPTRESSAGTGGSSSAPKSSPSTPPASEESDPDEKTSASRNRRRGSAGAGDAVVSVVDAGKEDSQGLGVISGSTLFKGTPPARRAISAAKTTAGCSHDGGPEVIKEDILVTAGHLQNVFVYISKGLDDWEPTPVDTEPLILDQRGCVYSPHVIGVRTGRPVHALNGDPISHNVHVISNRNDASNKTQVAGSKPLVLTFDKEEVPVTVVCDLHPWMKAYACVVEHPFFVVTGESGGFRIDGVPAGEYTLTAWHEKLGKQKATLSLGADGETSVAFTFGE